MLWDLRHLRHLRHTVIRPERSSEECCKVLQSSGNVYDPNKPKAMASVI